MYRIFTMCFFLSLISCTHDPFVAEFDQEPKDTISPPPGPPTGKPCDPDTVYFQNEILPLLVSNCAISGCHNPQSARDGVILNNYQNIMSTGDVRPGDPDGSDLYEVLLENDPDKRMPYGRAPLSSAQIAAVETWILQGAKNNSCDGCDTVDVKFSSHVFPIVQQYCQSCHSGSNPFGGLLLSNHSDVVSAVTNRSLLNNIMHNPGSKPMPPGGKLLDCEVSKVEIWINAGMPNN